MSKRKNLSFPPSAYNFFQREARVWLLATKYKNLTTAQSGVGGPLDKAITTLWTQDQIKKKWEKLYLQAYIKHCIEAAAGADVQEEEEEKEVEEEHEDLEEVEESEESDEDKEEPPQKKSKKEKTKPTLVAKKSKPASEEKEKSKTPSKTPSSKTAKTPSKTPPKHDEAETPKKRAKKHKGENGE